MPKVCVLILNRDRRDDTLACLASLRQSPYPNLEVVLLDNASSDGTAAGTVKVMTGSYVGLPQAALRGRVFFGASDGPHGVELWSSDGTPGGAAMVANIQPDVEASSKRTAASASTTST